MTCAGGSALRSQASRASTHSAGTAIVTAPRRFFPSIMRTAPSGPTRWPGSRPVQATIRTMVRDRMAPEDLAPGFTHSIV